MDGAVTEDFRRFDEWRFGKRPGYAVVHTGNVKVFRHGNSYDESPIRVLHSSPAARKEPAQGWRSVADLAHDDGLAAPTKSFAAPEHSDRRKDAHFRLLSEWLERCDSTHDHRREEPYPRTEKPRLPRRLLYVGHDKNVGAYASLAEEDDLFLVSTYDELGFNLLSPYIAVSHRWGHWDKKFQTTTANIKERKNRMSFSGLEKTFQDAIIVARRLGFNFLWIDPLCIVQDDKEELRDEIKNMEDIFSLASCTIAATSAKNGEKGLLCRSGVPASNNFDDEVEKAELSSRGWVLQERALSRRTIHFGAIQTYWECGSGIACEFDPEFQPPSRSLSSSVFPEFGSSSIKDNPKLVQDIFAKYSRLELSVKTDKPWAVAGLEYRLATYCGTLTVYGVFAKFFHKTLLWQRGANKLQHIDFSEEPMDEPPSWSWMAYTGGIDYFPVPDVGLTSKTYVKFDYPKIGTRCALVGPLWKVPMATSPEQCEDTNFNLNRADSDDAYWVRYDDDRDLKRVDCLEFMPILDGGLDLPSKLTYGLLIKANDQVYRRVGVASVQTGSDYAVSEQVRVI